MLKASVMLIVKDGLILSISRKNDHTKFGLIGGKCEDNETYEEAAIREVYEETGIEVKSCEQIFVREEFSKSINGEKFYVYAFYATSWEGKIIETDEGVIRWLTKDELISKEHGAYSEYNKATLQAFTNKFPNIYLK